MTQGEVAIVIFGMLIWVASYMAGYYSGLHEAKKAIAYVKAVEKQQNK